MKYGRLLTSAIALVALLGLFADTAVAQVARTGTIVGQVTDADGEPLPGVTVTVTSPAIIGGEENQITGANGRYRFPALRPGTYTVRVDLEGFTSQQQGDVPISSGTTLTVDFALTLGVSEQVTVMGEPPLIDLKSTKSAGGNISADFAQQLPSGRSASGLIDYAPGVVGDEGTKFDGRGTSAFGGTVQGTAFTFDGVNMNSTEGGEVEVRLDFDNVAEVSFEGVGAPAEVGGYSGMVVNLITKSGGNRFQANANLYGRPDGFNSQNSNDPEFRTEVNNNWNWHVDVGGPLISDKLWGYGSYRWDKSTFATELANGDDGFEKGTQWLAKLSWQPDSANRLSASLNWESEDVQEPADAFVAPEATLAPFGTFRIFNADYLHIFSEDTILEVKAGGVDSEFGDFPDSQSFGPARLDLATEVRTESPGFFFDGFRNRYQVNVALSHYADDFISGSHDFKAGLQHDVAKPRTFVGYTGGAYYVDYGGEPAYRYEFQSLDLDPTGKTTSVFVQDSWAVGSEGRLVLTPGVRFNKWVGSAKAELGAITGFPSESLDSGEHFTPSGIAPRLGAVYDLLGDGTTVVKAHYGKYFAQLIGGMYGGFQTFPLVEFQFSEWDPDLGEYVVVESEIASSLGIDPDIDMTYFNEFSLGLARELSRDWAVEFTFVTRSTKDFMDKVRLNGIFNRVTGIDPRGVEWNLYDLQNADEGEFIITNPTKLAIGGPWTGFEQSREFWSIGGTLKKRFSDGWQLQGSYVYSQTTGTDDTEFENGRGSSLGPSDLWSDPNQLFFADGKLATHVPHQIKLVGAVNLPWDVNAGFFYNYKTGRSYTRETVFPDVRANGRSVDIFTEERGTRTLPDLHLFDLRAEKAFTFGKFRAAALMDFFNVFNNGTVTRVRSEEDPRSDLPFERVLDIQRPRIFRLGLRISY